MKIRVLKKSKLLILSVLCILTGCRETPVPKPKGYLRIDLPAKEYRLFSKSLLPDVTLPLTFEYPAYGKISPEVDVNSEPGWFDIVFPPFRAKIYLTYREIHNDLEGLIRKTRISSHCSFS